MNELHKQRIYDAVNFLQSLDDDKAAFRNGEGFSKADSQVGHIAANLPFESWTDALTAEMAAVLLKYVESQLKPAGVVSCEVDELIIREIASEAKGRDTIRDTHQKLKAEEKIAIYAASRKITWERWEGGEFRFCISWSWDDPQKYDILEAVRDIPGRSYEPYHWGVPLKSMQEVKAFAEEWSFDVSAIPSVVSEGAGKTRFSEPEPCPLLNEHNHDDLYFYCKCKAAYCNAECDKVVECVWVDDVSYGKVFQKPQCPHCETDIGMWVTKDSKPEPTPHLRLVPEPTVEYVEPPLPLYPHQNEGIEYLRKNKKAFLTDEMGLGKTIQALLALPSATAALVVCPASLKGNWAREVKTWRPDLTPVILSGKGSFRWPCLGEIVIVNYELFPKEGEASYLNWEVNAIVDEAHYLKKSKAARTKKWRAISRDILEAGGSTWGMTGTPLVTTPYDLYGCLQSFGLLKQGYESYNNFVSIWGGYKGRFGLEWNSRKINERLAQEGLAKCSFGRKRIDVLPDLPSKRWTEIEVKLPKGCGEIDRDSLDELEAWANGGPTPVAGKIAEARKKLAVTKGKKALPFIDELIEGGGGPVVVFSAHVAPCQELGRYDRWECIVGDTPAEKRAEIVEKFQMGELDGIAGTVGAMGVGLTLTKSCRMVFIDLPWSNSEIAQAEDRICRIGQKNACEYFLITSNSEVDQIIHKSITRKTKMTANVDAVRKGEKQNG